MATIINCLRVVPKVTNTNTEPFVSLFTKRASRLAIVASFSSSTMSYEKELAAANKAASLAARLCQASLSLSLSCLYSLLVFWLYECKCAQKRQTFKVSVFVIMQCLISWMMCVCVCVLVCIGSIVNLKIGNLLIWEEPRS